MEGEGILFVDGFCVGWIIVGRLRYAITSAFFFAGREKSDRLVLLSHSYELQGIYQNIFQST